MQDLLANPKCSLLVAKDPEDRTDLVIIVYGDAVPVSCHFLMDCLFLFPISVSFTFYLSCHHFEKTCVLFYDGV